ncbi:hypothetical protein [Sphaerospermopsis reniformis]|uniref:hypothetical protein n=1 Tax=Sphaerospermopsis reniformis TaxID=531300 RepID=UPI001396CA39|nr:hypothetical protein [Sphaerospermopsis reniformis]
MKPNYQLSIINYQLSIINYQLSIIIDVVYWKNLMYIDKFVKRQAVKLAFIGYWLITDN